MQADSKKNLKNQKIKNALRENLKKRKKFQEKYYKESRKNNVSNVR